MATNRFLRRNREKKALSSGHNSGDAKQVYESVKETQIIGWDEILEGDVAARFFAYPEGAAKIN